MTENQSKYIADLANQKGVRLEIGNVSAAWASKKIDELKALPDKEFTEVTDEMDLEINKKIANIIKDLKRWTFQT